MFIDQNRLQPLGVKIYQAGGDLLVTRAGETQLTDANRTRIAEDRRTIASASDRPRRVEIASSGCGVEHRAWIVIAEVRKLRGVTGPVANSSRASGIVTFEFGQAFPEPVCVELGDFKRPIAALTASRPANHP